MGVSRQAIFKKIKAGELKAKKIGRNFIINEESLNEILGKTLAGEQKQKIEKNH